MFFKKPEYDWEQDFTESVRRVFEDETLSFEQALATVRAASGRQLFDFSERARLWTQWEMQDNRARASAMLKNAWRLPEHADVYLFFESCGKNGYLREQATRALRGYPGRLAVASALIRSEDWVDQVAAAAARLLDDLANTDAAAHLFDMLDLIVSLRSRQRFAARWASTLEPILLHPRWREARRRALTHGSSKARLLTHELSARADPEFAAENLRLGLIDMSPKVAQFALDRLNILPPEAARCALRDAMSHPLGSIRSAALRRYRQMGFDDVREIFVGALMDRNSSVRNAASYALEQDFGFSALSLWRNAFDAGRSLDTVTAALAESGDSSDGERLRSQLAHKRARVRAAALQGLLRIGAADAAALLPTALRDTSSAVARAAARGYSRGNESLDDFVLNAALATTSSARLHSRYISLSPLLHKWPRLAFLLGVYRKLDPTQWQMVDRQIEDWIRKANRSYARPSDELRQSLARSVSDLREFYPTRLWDQLQPYL